MTNQCPHLDPGGACIPMAHVVGEVSRVGKVDCDIACPRAQGPRHTGGVVTQPFIDWSVRRLAHGTRYSPIKVRRHLDATRLYLPPELPALREAFASIASVARLYVTGSAVLQPSRPIKDLDVVAIIQSPEEASELRMLVPKWWGGVAIDTFWTLTPCAVYAMVAFDLSEALVWNPDAVEVPFVPIKRRPPVNALATKLHEIAMGIPADSPELRPRATLPRQVVPGDFDPRSERRGCCDPPEGTDGLRR